MKTSAYYILHYGKEWLYWSIKSVLPFVDEVRIFYTPVPSHGHGTNVTCPETDLEIALTIAEIFSTYGNVHWHRTYGFPHEGLQRHNAVNTCVDNGADIIVVVDADELWNPDVLSSALAIVKEDNEHSSFRIGMRHLWRSMNWVCDDPAMPTRILRPSNKGQESYLPGKVYHMGYAQSPRIVDYKQKIHGHKAEWRPYWFEDKFMAWNPKNNIGDVHPTNEKFWYPKFIGGDEDHDKLLKLCSGHPYTGLEIIENGNF